MTLRCLHRCFALLLAATLLASAHAQPTNVVPTAEAAPPGPTMIEREQEAFSGGIISAGWRFDRFLERLLTPKAERRSEFLDRFLGDRRAEDDHGRGTRLRVAPGVRYVQDDGLDSTIHFSARLDLPRTRERLQLVVDNLQEDEDVLADIADGFRKPSQLGERSEETIALRLRAIERKHKALDFDAGLRFRPEPVPRFRIRGMLSPNWAWWDVRLYQSVFWYSDEGFGEKTELRTRRELSADWFVTSSSAALRSQESDGFTLGQSLNFGYVASKRTAWVLKSGLRASTKPTLEVEVYNLRLAYERLIKSNWVYFGIEPGCDFPRDRDYEFTPQITFTLKLLFGDV